MGDERPEAIVVGFQADAHDAAFFRPHIDAGFASRSPAFCLVHVLPPRRNGSAALAGSGATFSPGSP